MRTYKFLAAMAGCAVIGAGCAEDGKDGAEGPAGEKGDKGDQGEQGPAGEAGPAGAQGEAGADAPCAANPQLEITGVTGVSAPVFPGAATEFEVELAGGGDDVTVQFVGTAELLNGMATVPPVPEAGAAAGTFTVTPDAEGDYSYVAIATDGCSVATTTFTVKVRSALVSIVHVFPGAEGVGFMVRGEEIPLYGVAQGFFGPEPVFTIGQGSTYPGYFRLSQSSVDLDMYADADGDGLPDIDGAPLAAVPTLELTPDARVVVAAYADETGNLAWAVLNPDQATLEDGVNARFQFAHLAGGVGAVDISTSESMSPAIINDAALGTLSAGLLLPPIDYSVFVDANDDATAEFKVSLPFQTAQVLPGDYVVIIAWLDSTGALRILNHDTGGNGTQYEGMIFPFEGEVTALRGAPDVTGSLSDSITVTDEGAGSGSIDLSAAGCANGIEAVKLSYAITITGADPDLFEITDYSLTVTSPAGTEAGISGVPRDALTGTSDDLTDFSGEAVDGTWTVTITDDFGGYDTEATLDSATIQVWCN